MSDWPWIRVLSAVVFVLLVCGVLARRRKRLHISLMVTAMVTDVAMVVYLELTRAVVETVVREPMTTLMFIHIMLSVAVLVLYGVQIRTGLTNTKGGRSPVHAKAMPWLLLVRFGNLVTSFLVP